MSYLPVLALLDRMSQETAQLANSLSDSCSGGEFSRNGQRLHTLKEARNAIVALGIEEHEARPGCIQDESGSVLCKQRFAIQQESDPDKYYHPDGF